MTVGKKVPNPKKSSSKAERVGLLTEYITNPELANGREKCIHFEAENFITDDLKSQTQEMIALSYGAVRSKDPIDHYVLSWQEGEQPTIQQAREAVQMTLKHLGLEGHQVIWGMHADTDNVHIHIEVNRVHPETLKVVEINKGFQNNAIQQAAAIVEKLQGWKTHDKARFKTDEFGHLITDSKTKRPQVFKEADKPKEPTGQAKDKEIQTGEKSSQRLGIEQAAPIIAAATSWKQLHAELAKVGIEYQREGSGAKLLINNTAVKASDVVDRKNNFGALQKRLGLYQPSNTPEIKNDPFNRTQLITDTRFETGFDEPNVAATGFSTFNTLRDLPSRNLDVTNTTDWKKFKTQNLLQSHESSDNRGTGRVRRGSNSSGPERSAASQSRQPLKANQPGWTQYQQIKEAHDSTRSAERLALSKRHDLEKAELKAKQKEERETALKEVPKGNGAALNVMRSLIADMQHPATQELKERHKAELKAFQASYKSLPVYKVWQEQPLIVSQHVRPLIDQHITQDRQPQHVSQIIKQLTQRKDEHRHFTYALDKKDVFRDEGKIIKIIDLSSERGIAAALATAQQKYGDVLTLTGSDAFKQNAVAVAVEYNLTCRYDDPALEKLRTQFQAQKDAAVLEAARAERERAATERLQAEEKAALRAKAPEVAPSNPTREADEPAPEPEAQQQPKTQAVDYDPGTNYDGDAEHYAEELPAIDHLADIHEQIDTAKAAQAEAADAQKVSDAEEHRLSEPVQLTDIHKQIAAAQAAETNKNAPIHSAKISEATEADYEKSQHGIVLGSNEHFVAVRNLAVVTIYKAAELSKNVTYDGVATDRDRFATGNTFERKNGQDGMRTLLSEEREHKQTEAKRERDTGHGV